MSTSRSIGSSLGLSPSPTDLDGPPAPVEEPAEGADGPPLVVPADEVMKASAGHDAQAGGLRLPDDRAQGGRIGPDEGLVVFATGGQRGVLAREAAALGDLFDGHVAEAAEGKPGRVTDSLEGQPEIGVRAAEFEDAVAAVDPVIAHVRSEIPQGDQGRPAVLDDKGVRVVERPAPVLGLGPRLARAQDDRNPGRGQGLEGRTRRLERVGGVVEQGPVEVREDDQGRPLHAYPSVNIPPGRVEAEIAASPC